MSIVVMLGYLVFVQHVVGFWLFRGTLSSTCSANSECPEQLSSTMGEDCEHGNATSCVASVCAYQLPSCPGTYECSTGVCYQLHERVTGESREEHVAKLGFDSFGKSMVTAAIVVTLDDWHDAVAPYRAQNIVAGNVAWLFFAVSCLMISLFAVNLFLAGLAYSFIKVRATVRSLESVSTVKKTLVEKLLQESHALTSGVDRHLLQLINPIATRYCKKVLATPMFGQGIMACVCVNLVVMALDRHNKSKQEVAAFEVAEIVFTAIYLIECTIK